MLGRSGQFAIRSFSKKRSQVETELGNLISLIFNNNDANYSQSSDSSVKGHNATHTQLNANQQGNTNENLRNFRKQNKPRNKNFQHTKRRDSEKTQDTVNQSESFLSSSPEYLAKLNSALEKQFPLLEELALPPYFDTQKTIGVPEEQVLDMKSSKPIYSPQTIENCLIEEFGRNSVVYSTDWSEYAPVVPCYATANKLIRDVIRFNSATDEEESAVKDTAKLNELIEKRQNFIKNECDIMLTEINTGDASRHGSDPGRLLSDAGISERSEILLKAADLLGRNPNYHPMIKHYMLKEIHSIVSTSNK